jgi:isopentenyl-diphosphate delta-isomerase
MAHTERKSDHLRIAATEAVQHHAGAGLDAVRLKHRALPERDLHDVGLATRLLGRDLAAPLLISSMTGGTSEAMEINRRLMHAAARHRIGLVLGSGRRLLEDGDLLHTYRPAGGARPPLLLANLGAAQIRDPAGLDRAERLVGMLGADGLAVHLNPLQEAVQPEGEAAFSGVLAGLAALVEHLAPLPVVVQEVGFGLSGEDVGALAQAGVAAVDVAGAGGTNWALVEGHRGGAAAEVAGAFAAWGLPTVEALAQAAAAAPALPRLASGGVCDGVDCARCLALGAAGCGIARPLLLAAREDRAEAAVGAVVRQLRIATWLTGAASVAELGPEHLA